MPAYAVVIRRDVQRRFDLLPPAVQRVVRAGLRHIAEVAGKENALLHRPPATFHTEGLGVTYQLDPGSRTVRVSAIREEPAPRGGRPVSR